MSALLNGLRAAFGWLFVPAAPEPEPQEEDGPLPDGLYEFPPGTILTGHEPLAFYAQHRVADAARPILRYAGLPDAEA